MNRQEFVGGLRAALNGRVAPELVEDNVSYYQDYISVEMRKGRSEGEVLASLGDPRLIARTIVQTSGRGRDLGENGGYEEAEQAPHYEDAGARYRRLYRVMHLPGWLMGIIGSLAVILVIVLFFSVLSFLMPFLLVFAVVVFMVKLFHWLK